MLIDTHIHVGQFDDVYHSASEISTLMRNLSVDFYAVSSTTMCEENYEKVLAELGELVSIDGPRILPTMWITPGGLKGNIAWFLESDIGWKCLKVHPMLHDVWSRDKALLREVADIASELKVPVMVHTGVDDICRASIVTDVVSAYPDVDFILAHGRPISESIALLKNHKNVWVDTAFVSIEDINEFTDGGHASRLLWGTDMPIPKHFNPEEDMVEYYRRKLCALKAICDDDEYDMITFKNAVNLFGL